MSLVSLSHAICLRNSAPKLARTIVNKAALRPTPIPSVFSPKPGKPSSTALEIKTPHDFLRAIGRNCQEKMEVTSWEEFWKTSGQDLRKAGMAVRDRRYILWCMEKYRLGYDPREFAHEPTPKKTIRSWGPAVQNGKRIRSKRQKN